jgi:hypothetical protein
MELRIKIKKFCFRTSADKLCQTQEEDACIYIANVCMAVYEDIYYVFGLKRKFVLKLGLRLYVFLTL